MIGIAKSARRIELMAEDGRDASYLTTLGLHGADGEERLVTIRPIAPVECGMGIEDLQPAHDENEQSDHVQPMAETDGERMSKHPFGM